MSDLHVIPRDTWSDEAHPGGHLVHPVRHVTIHCTVVPDVRVSDEDMAAIRRGDTDAIWRSLAADLGSLRAVDRAHKNQGWAGNGYNFAGFDDGTCWEVRGWSHQGAHVSRWNDRALGYAWFINGDKRRPTDEAWATFARWMLLGLKARVIHPDFDLWPHREKDTKGKSCPGTTLTDREISDLERWVKATHRKG